MNMQENLIDGVGLWSEVLSNNNYSGKSAIFLDRDGTIIEDKGYLSNTKHIELIKFSGLFIKKCNENFIPVIIVTNQSGIGRGYYKWEDFYNVEIEVRKKLRCDNIFLDMVCACAYHSDGLDVYKKDEKLWRKPNAGMILEAKNKLNIDLSSSWIIGDKITDIEAGFNAGLEGGIFLNSSEVNLKTYKNYKLKQKENLSELDWLIDKLKN